MPHGSCFLLVADWRTAGGDGGQEKPWPSKLWEEPRFHPISGMRLSSAPIVSKWGPWVGASVSMRRRGRGADHHMVNRHVFASLE